jgi:hypothetical protein
MAIEPLLSFNASSKLTCSSSLCGVRTLNLTCARPARASEAARCASTGDHQAPPFTFLLPVEANSIRHVCRSRSR